MATLLPESQRSASAARGRRTLSRPVAFWAVAVTAAALLAASSAPSPLYPLLQAEYGFAPLILTAIFAVYVLALLASLLTVGRLSDQLGRRPVLAVALVIEAAAMALFLDAAGVGWLVAARVVQGLGTGAAVGVLGAYLLDLQPADGSRLGSLVNSAAPSAGLAVGTALTGALMQWAPAPTRLVFGVLTVLFAALAASVAALPETVYRRPFSWAALRPEVSVPPRARRAFAAAAPALIATWALGGLMFSVGGSLLGTVFAQTDHAVVGAALGVFAASGAVAAVLARDLAPAVMARAGVAVLAAGVALLVVAVTAASLAAFLLAAVVAGTGFGAGFLGALRSVTQLAEPHERAGLLSAVYVVSYLALSVPALAAGLLIDRIGLRVTSLDYGTLVGVVALTALALDLLLARRAPGRPTRGCPARG